MTHWSSNRKILAAGAAILAAAFVVSMTPWYRAYCAYDHAWTCAKMRKVIEWEYAPSTSEYEDGSVITGLCREGGSYTVHEVSDGHITVSCDVSGHDANYADLPEFRVLIGE